MLKYIVKSTILLALLAFPLSAATNTPWEFSEELRSALHEEDLPKISALFAGGASLEILNPEGVTPLMFAATYGKLKSLDLLVKLGAQIERRSHQYGLTAFMFAAQVEEIDAMKMLAGFGADVDAEDSNGFTPLMTATLKDHGLVARALKDCGADLNYQSKKQGTTALSLAAARENLEMITLLEELGAELNQTRADRNLGTTEYKRNPLMQAAINNRPLAIRKLAELGANLESREDKGSTALHLAVLHKANDAVKALLSMGANIEATRNDGATPLIMAAYGDNVQAFRALLAAGADTQVRDSSSHGLWEIAEGVNGEIKSILNWERDKKTGFYIGAAATALFLYKLYTCLFGAPAPAPSSRFARSAKAAQLGKQELESKKAELKKSLQSPFHAQPSFSMQGEFIPLVREYTDDLLQEYLDNYEKNYFSNLEYEVPLTSDEEEEKPNSNVKTIAPGIKVWSAPAKHKTARRENDQLPNQLTWEDVYQTRRFGEVYNALSAPEQGRLQARIKTIVETGHYGDFKHLATIKVVIDGKTIHCHLYELRFPNGLRIYLASVDSKRIHLLLMGDKKTQERDIASLKAADIIL